MLCNDDKNLNPLTHLLKRFINLFKKFTTIRPVLMEQSSEFNKFLSIQLKIQKSRDGLEVKLVSPIEFDAILYLTYDLRQFVVKPTGAYPAFDAIVVPILSITSMNTTEPATASDLNPMVHLRLTLPPFALSIAFPTDCRSFASFIESLEFLRATLSPSLMSQAQKEIHELRQSNEELNNTVEALRATKVKQDQVIQELSRLLKDMSVSKET